MSDVVHSAESASPTTSGCFESNDSAGDDAFSGLIAQKAAELMKLVSIESDVTAAQPLHNSSDNATTNDMTNLPSADTASCASDRRSVAGDPETPSEDAVSLCAFLCVFVERCCAFITLLENRMCTLSFENLKIFATFLSKFDFLMKLYDSFAKNLCNFYAKLPVTFASKHSICKLEFADDLFF